MGTTEAANYLARKLEERSRQQQLKVQQRQRELEEQKRRALERALTKGNSIL